MKAFHATDAIKDEYLARVRAHADADEIVEWMSDVLIEELKNASVS